MISFLLNIIFDTSGFYGAYSRKGKNSWFFIFFALNEQKYAICCLLMFIMAKKYDEIISDTL